MTIGAARTTAASSANGTLWSKYCSCAISTTVPGLIGDIHLTCAIWVRLNARKGATTSNATVDVAAHHTTGARFSATTATTTACTKTINTTNMFSSVDNTKAGPYSIHSVRAFRRAAATTNTVNQTAAAAVSAYDLASTPAHVTRGRIAKTMPAQTATVRVENCLATTTTPAAAIPTARQLDSRDQNSVAGKIANQPCIKR